MLNIAVCDDEEVIVSQLEDYLQKVCQGENIAFNIDAYYDGQTLEQTVLSGEQYDLIYLDIQMEKEDGIAAAKKIRDKDENVIFIFVSGYDKYLMDLFRLDVFGFLKKPLEFNSFSKMFLEAHKKISSRNFYFSFHYKNEDFKIPCKDILYFESIGRQISIHTCQAGVMHFNGKISEVEAKLKEGKIPFLRIHQSYLVNYYFIKAKSKTRITLVTGSKLFISENRQKEFEKIYGKLLEDEIDVSY